VAVGLGVGAAVGAKVVYSEMSSLETFALIAATSGKTSHAHVTFVSV
jgi:hypothetical protein